jgi:hypothetical protein
MKPEVKAAFYDWLATVIIGLIPILCHGALWLFADPIPGFSDNWLIDVLFICISTSGLSVVTVFTRMRADGIKNLDAASGTLMAVTVVLLVFSAMFYGMSASGHFHRGNLSACLILLGACTISSLYFELAIANAKIKRPTSTRP